MALSSGYQRRLQRAAPAADLPERQRTVLALRNFEGWTYAEIAAQLGCNAASARFSEYKTLKKMRAWMGND